MLSPARIASLLVFCGIALLELFAFVDRAHAGKIDAQLVPENQTSIYRFIVSGAPAGSPLHRGDHIAIVDPGELAASSLHALTAGSTVSVRRTSPLPQTMLAVPVVAEPAKLGIVILLFAAMFLGIATLVAARGRAPGSLSLAWCSALLVLLFSPVSPAWPHGLALAFAICAGAIAIAAMLCAVDFTTRFTGDPGARWARRLRAFSRVTGIASIAFELGATFVDFKVDATTGAVQNLALAGLVLQPILFLAGLALAYAKAPARDRQRVAWVTISLGTGILGFVAGVALRATDVPEPLRDYPLVLVAAMPLGCAYAILRYRLLDIGFVVNRATVFGITSLLVLAALALVDYGLQSWLGSWFVRTGMYVQLGLALAIGIATRPLHDRVDRVVDDLFFRRRHESERALRQFARDVAHIDDPAVLLQRTVDTVAHAAELRCAVYVTNRGTGDDGLRRAAASVRDATPLALDRNDGAVVRLLATREPIDLHDVDTALPGDFAFPMFARNRLSGLLVCDGKADGPAAYAPDELDAIGAVASAAGLTLDLLRIESLERELESLRATTGQPRRAGVRRVSES
jgi:hypothetical protein